MMILLHYWNYHTNIFLQAGDYYDNVNNYYHNDQKNKGNWKFKLRNYRNGLLFCKFGDSQHTQYTQHTQYPLQPISEVTAKLSSFSIVH